MRNFSLPEASIKQAIVNTQIIDKFFIKQTSDVKDSVEYLSQLTSFIKDLYKNVDLKVCLKDDLENYYGKFPNNKENCDFPHKFSMRFTEFNATSNKNKPPTIKEMFGRILFQVNGLSEEKCLAILEKYPTPHHLFDTYSNCSSDSEREKLLAQLKCGKQMRNLGPALSKTLSLLFFTKGPLN
jgi:crossover junction endonuclease MUS81